MKALNRATHLQKQTDQSMKMSNQSIRFARHLTIALLASSWGVLPATLHAEPKETQQKPMVTQRLFASPDEAVKALQAAAETKDKAAMCEVFGPEFRALLTGDAVQDANNAQRFATAVTQGCKPVKAG